MRKPARSPCWRRHLLTRLPCRVSSALLRTLISLTPWLRLPLPSIPQVSLPLFSRGSCQGWGHWNILMGTADFRVSSGSSAILAFGRLLGRTPSVPKWAHMLTYDPCFSLFLSLSLLLSGKVSEPIVTAPSHCSSWVGLILPQFITLSQSSQGGCCTGAEFGTGYAFPQKNQIGINMQMHAYLLRYYTVDTLQNGTFPCIEPDF